MVSSFARLAAFLSALCAISSAVSIPLAGSHTENVQSRDISRRSVPSAPRFVVYQSV